MKKLLLVLAFVTSFAVVIIGCGRKSAAEGVDAKDTPEDQRMVQGYHEEVDIEQSTLQHKLSAYESFETNGGTMDAYLVDGGDGSLFDLVTFLNTLGLDYGIFNYDSYEDKIAIIPNIPYTPEDDFKYVINFEDDMIHGHDLYVGSHLNGSWSYTEHYDSATDFIFQMIVGKRVYQIGADEFDQMYRDLRVLTAPLDKIGEVNEQIDQELAYTTD